MAVYNTGSDSANTSVRAFLTKIGEFYLKRSFNTTSGKGKNDWLRIQSDTFNSECAYCGEKHSKLTIEHLIMFNKSDCGLHHPGNIVPCCAPCNKRQKDTQGNYITWEDHLLSKSPDIETFKRRKQKIADHIVQEDYPMLNEDEVNALRAITSHLYSSTKTELEKAIHLYQDIDKTLIKRR